MAFLHPCINSISERLVTVQKALHKGTLHRDQGRFLTENYAFIYKEGPVPTLAMGRSGSAEPDKAGDFADKYTIPFIISVQIEDRDGDVVRSLGVQYKNFSRSPGVFFGHQEWEVPIGQARSSDGRILFWTEENRVRSACRFDEHDSDAMLIHSKVQKGFLNSSSLAFVPIQAWRRDREREKSIYESDWHKAKPHRDADSPAGWWFEDSDATEWSIVGVGSNPGALRDIYDQEKSFMSHRLYTAWPTVTKMAKSINESGGCFVALDGTMWCPRVEKSIENAESARANTSASNSHVTEGVEGSYLEHEHDKCGCKDCSEGHKCSCSKDSQPPTERKENFNSKWLEGWNAYADMVNSGKTVMPKNPYRNHPNQDNPEGDSWNNGSVAAIHEYRRLRESNPSAKLPRKSYTSVTKYIRHEGSKWNVYAESGKLLGSHTTESDAKSQLAAVEANKYKDAGVMTGGGTDINHPNASGQPLVRRSVILHRSKAAGLYFVEKRADGWYAVLKDEGEELGPFKSRNDAIRAAENYGKRHESNGKKSVVGSPEWAAEEAQEEEHQKAGEAIASLTVKTESWPRLVVQRFMLYIQGLGYKAKPQVGKDGNALSVVVTGNRNRINDVIQSATRWVDPTHKSLLQADMESGENQAGEIDRTKAAKNEPWYDAKTSVGFNHYSESLQNMYEWVMQYIAKYPQHKVTVTESKMQRGKLVRTVIATFPQKALAAPIVKGAYAIRYIKAPDKNPFTHVPIPASGWYIVDKNKRIFDGPYQSRSDAQSAANKARSVAPGRTPKPSDRLPSGLVTLPHTDASGVTTKSAKIVRYVRVTDLNKLGPEEEGWYVYENGQMVDGPYDNKAEADKEAEKTKQYRQRQKTERGQTGYKNYHIITQKIAGGWTWSVFLGSRETASAHDSYGYPGQTGFKGPKTRDEAEADAKRWIDQHGQKQSSQAYSAGELRKQVSDTDELRKGEGRYTARVGNDKIIKLRDEDNKGEFFFMVLPQVGRAHGPYKTLEEAKRNAGTLTHSAPSLSNRTGGTYRGRRVDIVNDILILLQDNGKYYLGPERMGGPNRGPYNTLDEARRAAQNYKR